MRSLLDKKIEINLLAISPTIATSIITDKQWLQENILCLLSNAVKYSVGGVVTISASLAPNDRSDSVKSTSSHKIEAPKHVIRINIEDTGIGIADDVICNLFNPFKQAQRLAGGTGLGLYSLAKRIEALGGSYGAQKRPDGKQGSLFWFTVPYRPDTTLLTDFEASKSSISAFALRDQTVSMDTVTMSPVSQHSTRVLNKLNILVVDDSLSILKMSSMMLRRQGHTVSTAENGAEALQLMAAAFHGALDYNSSSRGAESVKYDVVLMDLQMPIMDGLESTSRLRKLEKSNDSHATLVDAEHSSSKADALSASLNDMVEMLSRHQLIIGVSANSDNETMEAAFSAGIDDFIPKPFTLKSFNETYMKCLQARERVQVTSDSRGTARDQQIGDDVNKAYIGWGI
jgi:CheY-like chemotaxis protein